MQSVPVMLEIALLPDKIKGSTMIRYGISAKKQLKRSITSKVELFLRIAVLFGVMSISRFELSSAQTIMPGFSALACIEELKIPPYQGIVWQAQLTGIAKVTLIVSENGKAADLSVSGVHKALALWIRSHIEGARFHSTCAGHQLEYTFSYRLEGERSLVPFSSVVLRAPGHFIITGRPPEPMSSH